MQMDFDINQVIEFAKAGEAKIVLLAGPHGEIEAAILPHPNGGATVQTLKPLIDSYRLAPEYRKGTSTALTLGSFIDLTKRHADEDSAVFAQILTTDPRLQAVIDYHTTTHEARFGRHRVSYAYPVTPEWGAWLGQNGQKMGQEDFAEWIEEHIVEIGDPDEFADREAIETLFRTKIGNGAEIFTLSKGLALNVSSNVKDFRTLANGAVQVSYEEVHTDGSGQPLVIPGLFIVQVPFFVGGQPVKLIARLRYRKEGAKLRWFYELWKWDVEFRRALLADLDKVREATGLPCFEGMPEA
jgi:uncharacterized protein YfdQ (DUF2303 family)